MDRVRGLVVMAVSVSALTGCGPLLFGMGGNRIDPVQKAVVDVATQTLCDVDRARARTDLLKRMKVEQFREAALKVTKLVTPDEIADLRQLEASRRNAGIGSWEVARRRGELITEIYNAAIGRAGYKASEAISSRAGGISYTFAMDAGSAGSEPYALFMKGSLSQDPGAEGTISEITLGVNADQSRYYIGLNRFLRYDSQTDGTKVPIYSALSLLDAVEEALPRYCEKVASALDPDQFNTIAAVSSGSNPLDLPADTHTTPPVTTPAAATTPAAPAAPVASAPAAPTTPVVAPAPHA